MYLQYELGSSMQSSDGDQDQIHTVYLPGESLNKKWHDHVSNTTKHGRQLEYNFRHIILFSSVLKTFVLLAK